MRLSIRKSIADLHRQAQRLGAALAKFNPNHLPAGPGGGEFSAGSGGSAGPSSADNFFGRRQAGGYGLPNATQRDARAGDPVVITHPNGRKAFGEVVSANGIGHALVRMHGSGQIESGHPGNMQVAQLVSAHPGNGGMHSVYRVGDGSYHVPTIGETNGAGFTSRRTAVRAIRAYTATGAVTQRRRDLAHLGETYDDR